MWTPWKNKHGLSKAMAIFATVFLVATGLCGMNLTLIATGHGGGGGGEEYFGGPVLAWLGIAELLAMIVSGFGMGITGIIWIDHKLTGRLPDSLDQSLSILARDEEQVDSELELPPEH